MTMSIGVGLHSMESFHFTLLLPSTLGRRRRLSFAVWLTVKGVNVARWQEKAGHSTASL